MQKNEISAKVLNQDAQDWIEKLRQVLLIQHKGRGTVKSYVSEMILRLCKKSHLNLGTYENKHDEK